MLLEGQKVSVLYVFLGYAKSAERPEGQFYYKVGKGNRFYCETLDECCSEILTSVANNGRLAVWMMDWLYFERMAYLSENITGTVH